MRSNLYSAAAVIGLLGVTAVGSNAAQVTFASFQQSGSGNRFTLSDGSKATQALTQIGAFDTVKFQFLDFAAASLLNQDINGRLVISANADTLTATSRAGNSLSEDFSNLTFSIVANGNQVVNGNFIANGSLLLSGATSSAPGSFNVGGLLNGAIGGNSATLSGSDVSAEDPTDPFFNRVTFNSAYVSGLNNYITNAYAYSFSSVTPGITFRPQPPNSVNANSFFRGFTASGTGTFSSEAPVPEPGTVALLIGMGVSGGLLKLRRRRA